MHSGSLPDSKIGSHRIGARGWRGKSPISEEGEGVGGAPLTSPARSSRSVVLDWPGCRESPARSNQVVRHADPVFATCLPDRCIPGKVEPVVVDVRTDTGDTPDGDARRHLRGCTQERIVVDLDRVSGDRG